ncbi:hypothetical protein [Streptomyces canus]|uniref:hypothetical protein n=1 Tax=Streptomyces canus TaxID=58343 RepID=UPI0036E804F2
MTAVDSQIDRRLEQLHIWGPYALLGVGAVLAVASADLMDGPGEWYTAGTLVGAALLLQTWWHGTRHRRAHHGRSPSRAGTAYYAIRWAIAFVLTWINPFFVGPP